MTERDAIAAYLASVSQSGIMLCGACLRIGRCRLGVTKEELHPDGERFFLKVVCSADNEAGPNVSHGGWTAAILDEALGHLLLWKGLLIVTKTLNVEYMRPVPLERELEAHSWVEKHEGSKWWIAGELRLGDSVLAKATGLFIERDMSHFQKFNAWIAAQP